MENGGKIAERLRILHLEDDARDAELIRERLVGEEKSIHIDWARDEKEFVSFLGDGNIDLVLADNFLPAFNATAALELVKNISPGVPFIVVSGAIGDERAVDLLKNGATDYVLKDKLEKLSFSVYRAIAEVKEQRARKEAEAELRKREERHRTILQTAMDGYLLADETGQIVEVNDTYCRMSGYEADELLSLRLSDLDSPEGAADAAMSRDSVVRKGEARFESIHRRKNGEDFFVEVSMQYCNLGEGCFTAFLRDITERKKTQERLQLLDFAMDHVKESVFLYNKYNRLVYVNDEACMSLGYNRETLLRMTTKDFDPNWPEEQSVTLWDEITRKGSATLTSKHRAKNGRIFPVEISATYFQYQGEAYNLSLVRDITDRSKAAEIKRLVELTSNIAHELSEMVINYEAVESAQTLSGLGFSARQIEIARFVIAGDPSKAIAHNLGLTEATVKTHLATMYRRLNVNGRMEFSHLIAENNIALE